MVYFEWDSLPFLAPWLAETWPCDLQKISSLTQVHMSQMIAPWHVVVGSIHQPLPMGLLTILTGIGWLKHVEATVMQNLAHQGLVFCTPISFAPWPDFEELRGPCSPFIFMGLKQAELIGTTSPSRAPLHLQSTSSQRWTGSIRVNSKSQWLGTVLGWKHP